MKSTLGSLRDSAVKKDSITGDKQVSMIELFRSGEKSVNFSPMHRRKTNFVMNQAWSMNQGAGASKAIRIHKKKNLSLD